MLKGLEKSTWSLTKSPSTTTFVTGFNDVDCKCLHCFRLWFFKIFSIVTIEVAQ